MATVDTSSWSPDTDENTSIIDIPLNSTAAVAQTWEAIRALMAAFKGDTDAILAMLTVMVGATANEDGASGLVPAPEAGEQGKFLKGDGTWDTPTDTTYSDATQSASGLMSASDKTKLDGIETGADVNVIETVKVNGTALAVSSKAVNVPVPQATTTTPKANGTAAVGSETKWAKGDHVHPLQTNVSGNAGTASALASNFTIKLEGDVSGSAATNGTGTATITATVADDSHNHVISNVDGLQTALDGKAASSHSHAAGDVTSGTFDAARIPGLDASKITSGTIDIARLPAGALERLVTVANQTARYALTTADVQLGDTVKQADTGVMYIVVDTAKLNSADGYSEYTAGSATSVPWSGVTGKPSSFTPSSHTHGNITNDGKLNTASRAVVTDGNKKITVSSVTSTELGYLSGVTSAVQTQLDGKASSSHTHGNITNDGKVGTASGKPLITGSGGAVTAGSFGTASGTFCEGNDSRLSDSRNPKSHTHGNISNGGAIGSTSGLPVVTGTNGVLQAGSFGTTAGTVCEGNDSRLSDARTPTSHTHGSITNDGKLGTASRVVVTDGSKVIGVSSITTTKLGYLTDVTANIQGQIDGKADSASTLAGYGITDAKIASGTITLGSNTITPLTSSSSLDASKLTGTASVNTTGKATTAGTADKVANKLTLKLKSGSTEGTDLYTYDGSGVKTLDIKQGSNITLTAASGSLTIAGTPDTKNTAGSTDSSSKLFLIGATSQAANPQTYSHDTAYVGTDGCLYSGGTKVLTAHQDISGKADDSGVVHLAGTETISGAKTFSSTISGDIDGNAATATKIQTTPSAGSWVKAATFGGALVNASTTGFGAVFNAPTKDYRIAFSTYPRYSNDFYIYSVTNSNIESETNTVNKKLIWNASYGQLTADTFNGPLTGNADTATKFASSQSVALTGDVTGSASSQAGWSVATTLTNSGVTAGSYGPSANATPAYGATFNVPYITVDAKGRVTAASTKTVKIPASDNSDTKVTNTLATTTKAYVTGTTSSSTNTGTQVFDTGVYLDTTAGKLTATTFNGDLTGNADTATALATFRTISLTGDVTGSVSFNGSADASITATVADDSHNHVISNVDGLQDALDGKAASSHTHAASDVTSGTFATARIPNLNASKITAGTFATARIPGLDASKITSGTIDIDRLPAGALERLVTVADQTARFALTASDVQLGDTVKQLDTGLMYIVTDTASLSSEAGYTEYTAGSATSVPWSGVTGKPSSFTPSSHAHGNLTNDGKIGSTANLPLITTTSGKVTTGSFGTAANTFCQGNDSRLSNARTPTSHTHGSITNDGKLGTASRVVVTDSSKNIAVSAVTSTELGYLDGVTSNVQTQLNAKATASHTHGNLTNDGKVGTASGKPLITGTGGVVQASSFITETQIAAMFENDSIDPSDPPMTNPERAVLCGDGVWRYFEQIAFPLEG